MKYLSFEILWKFWIFFFKFLRNFWSFEILKILNFYEMFWNFGKYIDKSCIAQMFLKINTHYIRSVVVQDFVSGRVCCVNQYHYESR